ncbi:MAG: MATE family efflux transporter, partial [Alphaproteobacteria bacterium]
MSVETASIASEPPAAVPATAPPLEAPAAGVPSAAAARRAAQTRRLLHAPIAPTLLGLAAPNVVAVAAQTAVSMAEAWYVSRLGIAALAGLALVFPLVTMMQMMSAGAMGGGGASAVARALGAGDTARAEALLLHIIVIAAGMAALYSGLILGFGHLFYAALGGRDAVLEQALAYSGVVFAGAFAIWLMNMLASAIRGSGNMIVPASVILSVAALQVALGGALVLGWGPFPAL